MKTIRSLSFVLAAVGALIFSRVAFAHEGHNHDATGQLVAPTDKEATWVADQKAKYPTSVCIVSDDKLGGDMGKPVDFIYRVEGKPDRLVTFCCKDCVKDFNKDPDKYLKILDDAVAKKSGSHADHKD